MPNGKDKGPDNNEGFNKNGERIADVFDPDFGTVAAKQAAIESGKFDPTAPVAESESEEPKK